MNKKSTGARGPQSKFDLAEVRRLALKYPIPEVAERLGCSRSYAYELAGRAGVHLDAGVVDEERREEWVAALAEEPNQSAAARRMGVSRQAASRMAARIRRESEGVAAGATMSN